MNRFATLIINHDGHNKSLRIIFTKAVILNLGSLNEVRTRVLALRGLRPGPLVDEATEFIYDAGNIPRKNFLRKLLQIFAGDKLS